jgi:hypothetical protein
MYNRRILLERMVEIQNITLEYTKKGITQEWAYWNVILPRFFISKRTFYRYMGVNAKKEIKSINP